MCLRVMAPEASKWSSEVIYTNHQTNTWLPHHTSTKLSVKNNPRPAPRAIHLYQGPNKYETSLSSPTPDPDPLAHPEPSTTTSGSSLPGNYSSYGPTFWPPRSYPWGYRKLGHPSSPWQPFRSLKTCTRHTGVFPSGTNIPFHSSALHTKNFQSFNHLNAFRSQHCPKRRTHSTNRRNQSSLSISALPLITQFRISFSGAHVTELTLVWLKWTLDKGDQHTGGEGAMTLSWRTSKVSSEQVWGGGEGGWSKWQQIQERRENSNLEGAVDNGLLSSLESVVKAVIWSQEKDQRHRRVCSS